MRIIIILSLLLSVGELSAATIEKVDFPQTISVAGQKLILNGMGLRTKKRFGFKFKVYVAALWLPTKSNVANEVMAPGPKVLEIVFLRSLDKETMREAWTESFKDNCQAECEASFQKLRLFNDILADVKDQDRLKMVFAKSSVTIELNGVTGSSGRIEGVEFTRNLMAAFIGPKPPSEDLKKGLLGEEL